MMGAEWRVWQVNQTIGYIDARLGERRQRKRKSRWIFRCVVENRERDGTRLNKHGAVGDTEGKRSGHQMTP